MIKQFTFEGPLAAVLPLAVSFLITTAFLWLLAGDDGLGLVPGESGTVPNFLSFLRRSISGKIFGRTPPDAIVTCFKSYIHQTVTSTNTTASKHASCNLYECIKHRIVLIQQHKLKRWRNRNLDTAISLSCLLPTKLAVISTYQRKCFFKLLSHRMYKNTDTRTFLASFFESNNHLMQLLIISNCKKNMTWCNTSFLVITSSIPSQLQNLRCVHTQHAFLHYVICKKNMTSWSAYSKH